MGGSAPFTSFVIFHVAIVVTRLSPFIPDLSEIQPIKNQKKTDKKNPTPKPSCQLCEEPYPLVTIWGTSSGLSWGENSGIETKPFGFGSLVC